jgi:hypothetical protein
MHIAQLKSIPQPRIRKELIKGLANSLFLQEGEQAFPLAK